MKHIHNYCQIWINIYIYINKQNRKIRTPSQLTSDQSSLLQHCVNRSRYLQHLNTALADPATYNISTLCQQIPLLTSQHCASRSRYLQHLNTVLADPATYNISTLCQQIPLLTSQQCTILLPITDGQQLLTLVNQVCLG